MVNVKKRELIEELKTLRIEKNITYQQIVNKTIENGTPVSLSTVKHVFSDKYNHDHDYENVLKPIAEVLSPPSDDDQLEIKILQTRLELKEEIISQLRERIDRKESKHKKREEFLMDQLQFYREQIQFKDSQIKRLNEAIDRKDAMIREKLIEENN